MGSALHDCTGDFFFISVAIRITPLPSPPPPPGVPGQKLNWEPNLRRAGGLTIIANS
jgi:hypothetical protein